MSDPHVDSTLATLVWAFRSAFHSQWSGIKPEPIHIPVMGPTGRAESLCGLKGLLSFGQPTTCAHCRELIPY